MADAELSLAEQAYRDLEEKLVTLQLPPGSLVSEGQLIEMTGLGRTPVREAMQRLAHQELFQVLPRKGLLVTPISKASMQHILETRKPLERVIAYRASLNARDDQRSGFTSIARQLAISHDSFEEFLQLDRQLDDLLDRCAGNPYASTAVAPLRTHCRRFWYNHRMRMQLSDSITAHSTMARLIARRDYNGAKRAADAVIGVVERLVATVEQ